MDNTITDGVIMLGKIVAILIIFAGVMFGISLVSYGIMSMKFDGKTTTATIDSKNVACVQKLDLMMQPRIDCDVPITYNVDGKPMTLTLNNLPKNALSAEYPVAVSYENADPSKVSLLVFDKSSAPMNIVLGIFMIIISVYIGMWIYKTNAFASVLGIGQLGRMIVG
jgi:hypothetical protein